MFILKALWKLLKGMFSIGVIVGILILAAVFFFIF